MNSINIGWDSTKQAEMPYFHCGPSGVKDVFVSSVTVNTQTQFCFHQCN